MVKQLVTMLGVILVASLRSLRWLFFVFSFPSFAALEGRFIARRAECNLDGLFDQALFAAGLERTPAIILALFPWISGLLEALFLGKRVSIA